LKKSLTYSLVALSILLVLSASTNSARAENYNFVGVKLGDTATYRLSQTGTTDNKTTVLVYGIVGSLVYLNFTNYTPSGTVDTKNQILEDVYTGGIFCVYLIAGNLSKNDGLYHGSTGLWINDTTSMIISGVNRTVNHSRLPSGLEEVWWDKETGLMVKANIWVLVWINYTMVSTTAWSSSPPSGLSTTTLLALGEGAIILLLLVYIVVVRRGSRKR
jgi:hypothetical protein